MFKTVLEKNRKIKTSGITKAVFQNLEFCPTFVPSSKNEEEFDAKMMSCDVAMLYAKKKCFKTQSVKKCALDFL